MKKIDPALACMLLLALALRLQYVTLPFLDAHRWREVDTLVMARYFHEDSFNIFYPQVNWGGPARAYVECEFPLLPAIAAVLFTFTGVTETTCRLVTIAFSIGAIIALYALARQILGVGAARAAAFLAAISPSFVYYGRSFIPDIPMLAFSIASLAWYVSYFRTEKRSDLWLASAATAIGWLSGPGVPPASRGAISARNTSLRFGRHSVGDRARPPCSSACEMYWGPTLRAKKSASSAARAGVPHHFIEIPSGIGETVARRA